MKECMLENGDFEILGEIITSQESVETFLESMKDISNEMTVSAICMLIDMYTEQRGGNSITLAKTIAENVEAVNLTFGRLE